MSLNQTTNYESLDLHQGKIDDISDLVKSTLISKNITILGRRTSVRLEPEMWNALKDISRREHCSMHDICTLINMRKNPLTSLTAAIRVFLMLYYRAASTQDGHAKAGHGDFENMKRRARLEVDFKMLRSKNRLSEMSDNSQLGYNWFC